MKGRKTKEKLKVPLARASGEWVASEKLPSTDEASVQHAAGPEALRGLGPKFEAGSSCGCMDRCCSICQYSFAQETSRQPKESSNAVGGSFDDEACHLGAEVVIDVDGGLFEVDFSCSRLRSLDRDDDSEWDLISCEVPVVSGRVGECEIAVLDEVSGELDEMQLSLKGLMGRERAILKRQLDTPEDMESSADSSVSLLGELSRQVGAIEEELFRIKGLKDDLQTSEADLGVPSPEVILQTKTIPTEQVLRVGTRLAGSNAEGDSGALGGEKGPEGDLSVRHRCHDPCWNRSAQSTNEVGIYRQSGYGKAQMQNSPLWKCPAVFVRNGSGEKGRYVRRRNRHRPAALPFGRSRQGSTPAGSLGCEYRLFKCAGSTP